MMPPRLPLAEFRSLRGRGFSLVEMMIAAAVMLFMLTAVTQLALVSTASSEEAVMTAESARYAQSLIEEQVALGYTYLQPKIGTTNSSTYTPVQGRQITATVQFTDASGPVTPGSTNIGAPAVLISCTTTWDHPIKGPQIYSEQVYVTPPPTTPAIPGL